MPKGRKKERSEEKPSKRKREAKNEKRYMPYIKRRESQRLTERNDVDALQEQESKGKRGNKIVCANRKKEGGLRSSARPSGSSGPVGRGWAVWRSWCTTKMRMRLKMLRRRALANWDGAYEQHNREMTDLRNAGAVFTLEGEKFGDLMLEPLSLFPQRTDLLEHPLDLESSLYQYPLRG
jgi:hypothetical protein